APLGAPAMAAHMVRRPRVQEGQQLASIPAQEQRPAGVPEPRSINLTGAWRGGPRDGCHLIKQTGHSIEVTNFYPESDQVRAIGEGTLTGRRLQMRMNRQTLESVTVDMFVSDDGRELTGEMQWKQQSHVALWHRIGPSCR